MQDAVTTIVSIIRYLLLSSLEISLNEGEKVGRIKCKKVVIGFLVGVFPIIVYGIIIFLTLQNSSDSIQLARGAQSVIAEHISIPSANKDQSWFYNIARFRKIAHIVEYFFMGISTIYSFWWFLKKKCIFVSCSICCILSVLDQYIKYLVPGKEFDAGDLLFDSAGYILGILIVLVFIKMYTSGEEIMHYEIR